MTHVFKLGPLDTDESAFSVYAAQSSDGLYLTTGEDDVAALGELQRQGARELCCEPALKAAAAALGLKTGPLPAEVIFVRALMAVAVANDLTPEQAMEALALLSASELFEAAAPWERLELDAPLRIELSGAVKRSYRAFVVGGLEVETGLVLYPESSGAALEAAFASGTPEALVALESLDFAASDGPAFAAEAVAATGRATRVPLVVRMKRGETNPPTADEVLAVAAAINAVVDLAIEGRGTGEAGERSRRVKARAFRTEDRSEEDEDLPGDRFAGVARNDPCPCGSGKKFKRCHLGSAAAVPSPASTTVAHGESVHDRDVRLISAMLEFLSERRGEAFCQAHLGRPFGDRLPQLSLGPALAAYETLIDGTPLARQFLAARGSSLSADDRHWIQAALEGRLGLWETLRVEPGKGLELIDLIGGQRLFVEEKEASRELTPRTVLLARVVTVDGSSVVAGVHDRLLGPTEARKLLGDLRASPRPPDAARLVQYWDDAVSAQALARAAPGVATNTDGERLEPSEWTFKLSPGARDEVVARFLGIEGAVLEEDGARQTHLTLTKPGNAMQRSWKATAMAGIRITKTKLVLFTNSNERAERYSALVERSLGALARPSGRKTLPLPDFRGQEIAVDTQVAPAGTPEALLQESEDAWMDEPIPALGGKTPRESISTTEGREDVHWLLKDMEVRDPAGGARLRRLLGLTELGEPSPHHLLDLAVGAGSKLSETILRFAQPLLEEAPKQDAATMRSVLGIAATAWNAAASQEDHPAAIGEVRRGLAADPAALRSFDALVERKRRLFPIDRRLVGNFEVLERRGELSVQMETRLPQPLIELLSAAGIKPAG